MDAETRHNLKSPLTGIQMILHLLAEEQVGPLNEQQKKMVAQAINDCTRLVNTIKEVTED